MAEEVQHLDVGDDAIGAAEERADGFDVHRDDDCGQRRGFAAAGDLERKHQSRPGHDHLSDQRHKTFHHHSVERTATRDEHVDD